MAAMSGYDTTLLVLGIVRVCSLVLLLPWIMWHI